MTDHARLEAAARIRIEVRLQESVTELEAESKMTINTEAPPAKTDNPGAIDYEYLLDRAAQHAKELETTVEALRERVAELEEDNSWRADRNSVAKETKKLRETIFGEMAVEAEAAEAKGYARGLEAAAQYGETRYYKGRDKLAKAIRALIKDTP